MIWLTAASCLAVGTSLAAKMPDAELPRHGLNSKVEEFGGCLEDRRAKQLRRREISELVAHISECIPEKINKKLHSISIQTQEMYINIKDLPLSTDTRVQAYLEIGYWNMEKELFDKISREEKPIRSALLIEEMSKIVRNWVSSFAHPQSDGHDADSEKVDALSSAVAMSAIQIAFFNPSSVSLSDKDIIMHHRSQ